MVQFRMLSQHVAGKRGWVRWTSIMWAGLNSEFRTRRLPNMVPV